MNTELRQVWDRVKYVVAVGPSRRPTNSDLEKLLAAVEQLDALEKGMFAWQETAKDLRTQLDAVTAERDALAKFPDDVFEKFKAEPVAVVLGNVLRYCEPEHIETLRDALDKRTRNSLAAERDRYKAMFTRHNLFDALWPRAIHTNSVRARDKISVNDAIEALIAKWRDMEAGQ